MKASRGPTVAFCVLLAVSMAFTTTCENVMLETVTAVVTEYQKPRATLNFESGSGLADTTEIVITFTESMDPTSVSLSGAIGQSAGAGVWSAGTDEDGQRIENAVLTIRPAERWPLGSGKDLVVAGANTEEFRLDTIDVTYGVLDGVVYVHARDGRDYNPGTIDQPKRTIASAVREAERVYDTAEVRVAGGVYQVTSTTVVSKDISLYGGFDPDDWSVRDPAVHETKWNNIRTSGSHATLSYQPGVGEVILDGFTITAGNGSIALNEATAAIFVSGASPVIRNNTIVTGIAARAYGISASGAAFRVKHNRFVTNALEALVVCLNVAGSTVEISDNTITGAMINQFYGFFLDSSQAVVERNSIDAAQPMNLAYGVNVNGGAAVIRNNVISAGSMNTSYVIGQYGIFLSDCEATLHNNTIDGGTGVSADGIMTTAIMLYYRVTSTIENNVIFTRGGDLRTGVWQVDDASFPTKFSNNVMFGCPDGKYFHGEIGDPGIGWIANMTAEECNLDDDCTTSFEEYMLLNEVPVSGNVFLTGEERNTVGLTPAPHFRPFASTDESIRIGGKNLSTFFSDDFDGQERTVPWSVGAYEWAE